MRHDFHDCRRIYNSFAETLKDSEFLADAKKSNLVIDPVSGGEIEKIVLDLFKLEPETINKFNEILK